MRNRTRRNTYEFANATLTDGTTLDVLLFGQWNDPEPDVGFRHSWFESIAVYNAATEDDITDDIHSEWLIGAINALNAHGDYE